MTYQDEEDEDGRKHGASEDEADGKRGTGVGLAENVLRA